MKPYGTTTAIQRNPVAQICDHEKGKMQSVYRASVKFIFPSKWAFLIWQHALDPCQVITSFLLSSLFVAVGLLSTRGKQEENRKDTATMSEASKKPAYKTGSPLI